MLQHGQTILTKTANLHIVCNSHQIIQKHFRSDKKEKCRADKIVKKANKKHRRNSHQIIPKHVCSDQKEKWSADKKVKKNIEQKKI